MHLKDLKSKTSWSASEMNIQPQTHISESDSKKKNSFALSLYLMSYSRQVSPHRHGAGNSRRSAVLKIK